MNVGLDSILRVLLVWLLAHHSLAAAQTLLVANKSDDTLSLVDLSSGETTATLPTGHAPHEVVVSPDGKISVVSNYGDRAEPGSTLTVFDVKQGGVLRTIDLGKHTRPHGLAWLQAGQVAVTTEGSAHLLVVDPEEGKVLKEIPTDQEVSHMVVATPDGKRAFVANIGSGTVTAVDLEAGRKIRDIESGAGAEGLAITPDGKQVWVSNRSADTLAVIDVSSLDVVDEIPSAGFPIRVAITPDGQRALVSCAQSGEVAVFDTKTHRELLRRKLNLSAVKGTATRLVGDTFGASPVPVGLLIAPGGKRAFVAATQADAVVVVNPQTLEVIDLISAGQEPDGMAYSTQ